MILGALALLEEFSSAALIINNTNEARNKICSSFKVYLNTKHNQNNYFWIIENITEDSIQSSQGELAKFWETVCQDLGSLNDSSDEILPSTLARWGLDPVIPPFDLFSFARGNLLRADLSVMLSHRVVNAQSQVTQETTEMDTYWQSLRNFVRTLAPDTPPPETVEEDRHYERDKFARRENLRAEQQANMSQERDRATRLNSG